MKYPLHAFKTPTLPNPSVVLRLLLLLAPILLIILMPLGTSFASGYDLEIDQLFISMHIGEDNHYRISEEYTVTFNRNTMHGIFRDIPQYTYFGKRVKLENVQVPTHPFTTERIEDYLRLKIGDPSQYARAKEVYKIFYTYPLGDDRNSDMDELYFNLVGTQWRIPIHKVSFRITMPKEFDASRLAFTYGRAGQTLSEGINWKLEGNTLTGHFNQTLNPGQALTIALPLPEGYYTQVTPDFQPAKWLYQFLPFLAPLLFLLGWYLWYRYGKNDPLIPVVSFYPPENLSPMEMGYVYDHQLDAYDYTAMLIYWAHKGYMRIIESEENYNFIIKFNRKITTLEKLSDLPYQSSAYEQLYFDELFSQYGTGGTVRTSELANHFYKTLNKVGKSLRASFNVHSPRPLRTRHGFWVSLSLFATASLLFWLGLVSIAFAVEPYSGALILWIVFMVSLALTGITSSASRLFKITKTRLPKHRVSHILSGSLLALIPVGLFLLSLFVYPKDIYSSVALLFATIMGFLVPYAHRLTPQMRAYQETILGFKEFIEKAERSRIELLVHENPSYFYDVLPYAMALGVTDAWANQFEFIAIEPPSWYTGHHFNYRFNAVSFAQDLTTCTQGIGQSMTSTPSSSSSGGSSGGGSSGGGSGGGGGGGW